MCESSALAFGSFAFTFLAEDSLEILGAAIGISGVRGVFERTREVDEGELFGECLPVLSVVSNGRVFRDELACGMSCRPGLVLAFSLSFLWVACRAGQRRRVVEEGLSDMVVVDDDRTRCVFANSGRFIKTFLFFFSLRHVPCLSAPPRRVRHA